MKNSKFFPALFVAFVLVAVSAAQTPRSPKAKYVEYDETGNVPIATTGTGSKLAVGGIIESTLGGIKFPDGTTQTSSGLTQVVTAAPLSGNGTPASPLTLQTSTTGSDPDATRQPFNKKFVSIPGQNGTVLETVPAGKVLIVEFMTGYTALPNTSNQPVIELTINNSQVAYVSPRTVFTSAVGFVLWNYSDPIKLRLTAGQVLGANFVSPGGENLVIVNGYYVNAP